MTAERSSGIEKYAGGVFAGKEKNMLGVSVGKEKYDGGGCLLVKKNMLGSLSAGSVQKSDFHKK